MPHPGRRAASQKNHNEFPVSTRRPELPRVTRTRQAACSTRQLLPLSPPPHPSSSRPYKLKRLCCPQQAVSCTLSSNAGGIAGDGDHLAAGVDYGELAKGTAA
jgi:hypothetical protein